MLWPVTEAGKTVETFCSDLNPSFGFGPYATRRCRDNATWSRVDTSQCSIRPMQQSTIVVSSIFVEVDSINSTNINSAEIMQVSRYHIHSVCMSSSFVQLRALYNDSSLISTELTVLPDRLYTQAIIDNDTDTVSQNKRQITSSDYSILAPVILTVTIMNNTVSAENVTQMIRNIDIDVSGKGNEVIGFNGVGMLKLCTCILRGVHNFMNL